MKIGLLGVRGLPPSYGAFCQTAHKLVEFTNDVKFAVGCDNTFKGIHYTLDNKCERIFSRFSNGFGVILFNLLSFSKMYIKGYRNYIFFGYGLSIFFPVFKLMGCNIICNVDGFEWRRDKWRPLIKYYFKICEKFAALHATKLVFDANVISRYYSIKYKKQGSIIRYGYDIDFNVDPKIIEKYNLMPNDYFIVVMRLEPENNIKTIIDAFVNGRIKNKLVIVGPTTKFFDEIFSKVYSSNILYIGPIYNRNILFNLRKHAKCYIHGHSVGGTNPTLVEALAIGTPILAYDTSFNREVIKSNNNIFFRNSSELCLIINNMLISRDIKNDPEYLWEKIAEKYINLFQ